MRRVDRSSRHPSFTGLARERVLYVEDDDDNWEVAKLRLRDSYDLVRARTAEEACTIVRTEGRAIALILMDIELRGSELTGVQLTRLLRGEPNPGFVVPSYAENLPPVSRPIVFVTAHGAKHTRVQLMLAGAEQVIAKPVDFDELRDAIAELTSERTSPGQRPR